MITDEDSCSARLEVEAYFGEKTGPRQMVRASLQVSLSDLRSGFEAREGNDLRFGKSFEAVSADFFQRRRRSARFLGRAGISSH